VHAGEFSKISLFEDEGGRHSSPKQGSIAGARRAIAQRVANNRSPHSQPGNSPSQREKKSSKVKEFAADFIPRSWSDDASAALRISHPNQVQTE
jgi:hypothetical protein